MDDPDDGVGEISSEVTVGVMAAVPNEAVGIISSSDDVCGVLSTSDDEVGVMASSVCEGNDQLGMDNYISVEVLDAANVVEVKSEEELNSKLLGLKYY